MSRSFCPFRATGFGVRVPRAALRSALGYIMKARWAKSIKALRGFSATERSRQHESDAPNGATMLKPRAKRSVALGYLENTVRRPEKAICLVHFAPSGQRDLVCPCPRTLRRMRLVIEELHSTAAIMGDARKILRQEHKELRLLIFLSSNLPVVPRLLSFWFG